VVCLKHVGITDWVRERLKMSVNTLVSARRTRPGNPSDPVGFVNVQLFKKVTSARENMITKSSRTAGALTHGSVLLGSEQT
jgi:hypothetical protein